MNELNINIQDLNIEDCLFKDVKYYITGTLHEKIVEILRQGGAEQMNYFSDYVTHLICGSEPDENDLTDANDVYEIPAVTQRWVLTSAKIKKKQSVKAFKYDQNLLFNGMIFSFSNITDDNYALWALITYNGGLVKLNLDPSCTHLLTTDTKSPKYLKAFSLYDRIKIVTPDWVLESLKNKILSPCDIFHPKLLTWPKPRESTALITGFEQDDTEKVSDIPETESTQALLDKLKQRMPWNQPTTTAAVETTSKRLTWSQNTTPTSTSSFYSLSGNQGENSPKKNRAPWNRAQNPPEPPPEILSPRQPSPQQNFPPQIRPQNFTNTVVSSQNTPNFPINQPITQQSPISNQIRQFTPQSSQPQIIQSQLPSYKVQSQIGQQQIMVQNRMPIPASQPIFTTQNQQFSIQAQQEPHFAPRGGQFSNQNSINQSNLNQNNITQNNLNQNNLNQNNLSQNQISYVSAQNQIQGGHAQQFLGQTKLPQRPPMHHQWRQQLVQQQLNNQQQLSNQQQQLSNQQIVGEQLSGQQIVGQQMGNQQIVRQQIVTQQQLNNQQLGAQQIVSQQLNNQQIVGQQLNNQQQMSNQQQLNNQQLNNQQMNNSQLTNQQLRVSQLNEQLNNQQIGSQQQINVQQLQNQQLNNLQLNNQQQQQQQQQIGNQLVQQLSNQQLGAQIVSQQLGNSQINQQLGAQQMSNTQLSGQQIVTQQQIVGQQLGVQQINSQVVNQQLGVQLQQQLVAQQQIGTQINQQQLNLQQQQLVSQHAQQMNTQKQLNVQQLNIQQQIGVQQLNKPVAQHIVTQQITHINQQNQFNNQQQLQLQQQLGAQQLGAQQLGAQQLGAQQLGAQQLGAQQLIQQQQIQNNNPQPHLVRHTSPQIGAIGAPRLNWSPNQPQGVMPQRQLIHLDAQTHQQLQQMDPQQRTAFIARIQKHRQLMVQRQLLQQQQQRGGHIVIRGGAMPPGLNPQQQVQWLQQQGAKQQTVVMQPQGVVPAQHAPGLSPIAQTSQQVIGDQTQQLQIQRQQYQRLQQLQMQREQAQKQVNQVQIQTPPVPIPRPPLPPPTPQPVEAPPAVGQSPETQPNPQQLVVNAKTKTALANMLSIRLQSGSGTLPSVPEGEPSAAGTLRMMTAQHNASMNPTTRPQELLAMQQRRALGNITNGEMVRPPAPTPVGQPPGPEPAKQPFSPGRVLPPPPQRHGPFYGHNPNLKLPPDLFLLGCIFVVVEVDRYLEETSPDWRQVIEKHGGEVEPAYCTRVTHVLCETQRHGVVMQALRDYKRCVTLFWLNDVVQRRQVTPPWQALHLPTGYIDGAPASRHLISLSGFHGPDRSKIIGMIKYTGAKFTGYFSRHNTVLVCGKSEGAKYQHAKKWNIPIVNVQWLTDLMLGNFSALNQMEHVKYQQFPQPVQFGFDTALVPNLMFAWKMPINISQESYERVKRSPSPVVMPPKAKKPRTDDCITPIKTETPMDMHLTEYSSTYCIMFSLYLPKEKRELENIVSQLGGSVATSIKQATHLIMSQLGRTSKLINAISLGLTIVPDTWLKECEKEKKFISEAAFKFDTTEFDERYHCEFYKTLEAKNRDKLFANKIFFVTPSVFTNITDIKEMIESCGGTVEKKRRSLPQIETLNANVPLTYIIITHEKDLHLVYDCLRNGNQKFVSSCEIVFNAVLNQMFNIEEFLVRIQE